MDKRPKVAILYVFDYDKVTGVVIYLLNIIRTLKTLDDKQRPHLVFIYTGNSPIEDLKAIDYPHCTYYLYESQPKKLGLFQRAINKFSRRLLKKELFLNYSLQQPLPRDIESAYPYFPLSGTELIPRKIYWKADFQEKYYPDFFSQQELDGFDYFMHSTSGAENTLVLSSNDAWNDFKKFYPSNTASVKLLRFASFLPDFSDVSIEMARTKFNINKPYFFIANQFWPHKNHMVILQAMARLKNELDCLFVFTGKTTSYRDAGYFPSLQQFIDDHGLSDHIRMLGFIDRKEQLQLMNHSLAIIQPSLFEGWSTVIEDAKALNRFVIASNLRVNQEQIAENCLFFSPHDADTLADHIRKVYSGSVSLKPADYQQIIQQFKNDIANIFALPA